jgi:hypothetical protein
MLIRFLIRHLRGVTALALFWQALAVTVVPLSRCCFSRMHPAAHAKTANADAECSAHSGQGDAAHSEKADSTQRDSVIRCACPSDDLAMFGPLSSAPPQRSDLLIDKQPQQRIPAQSWAILASTPGPLTPPPRA